MSNKYWTNCKVCGIIIEHVSGSMYEMTMRGSVW